MRSALLVAVAFGPLGLAASPAIAASIDSSTTAPVATSTSGDVTLTSGGAIKLTGAGAAAVTLDSNNAVANGGTIDIENANNTIGILIQGGTAGSVSTTGTLQNAEDFAPSDANSDGVVESPLAQGSGRYGIRLVGTAPFTGSITTGGSILIKGADSSAVSIEAPLNGSIIHSGTIGVTGDRSYGIRTLAPVNGAISITGSVGASGQGAAAVSLGGDVSGPLTIYSSVFTNGYSTSTRQTDETKLRLILATLSELQQSGSALVIGGSIAGGFFLGAPPVGSSTTSTGDIDGDGIADNAEGTGSLSLFGSAPVLLIGTSGKNITIGPYGTGLNGYGVILRGAVTANGLYDGISSTGIQIGGMGGGASLAGGLRITGAVSSSAYEAAATGLRIGAGGVVPELRLENGMTAAILHSTVGTATNATATGLLIEAGGSLSTLTNLGSLTASATGPTANASAVVDQSGSLSTVNNQGTIAATLTPVATGDPVGGRTIALDLRANTAGVTLTQSTNPSPITLAVSTDSTGATVTTTTPTAPSIVGDVLLGSGPNTVQIQTGSLTGALDLGSGAANLSVGAGASVAGPLSHAGSALSLNISGSLVNTSPTVLQASSLTLNTGGTLSIAVDPANSRAGGFTVAGTAALAPGSTVGINLLSNPAAAQSFTLIRANTLNVGSLASLETSVPFVTVANLRTDPAAGTLSVDLRRRTAAEAGLNPAETAAYDATLNALPKDPAVEAAVLGASNRASFVGLYDQFLPDYGGAVFRLASAASRSVGQAWADGPEGGWVQEITLGARQSASTGTLAYKAWMFGLAGGTERRSALGLVGIDFGFFTGDSHAQGLPDDNHAALSQLQVGLSWRTQVGGLRFNARAGGAYDHFNFQRQFVVQNSAGAATLTRTAKATASGWSASGSGGMVYHLALGNTFYLEPGVHIDYYRLVQGAYAEQGGGDTFDLDVEHRIGQETSATVSVKAGAVLGQEFRWRPETEIGYREILTGSPGALKARYEATGDSFTLAPSGLEKGGGVARIGLNGGNDLYDLSFSAGVEERNGYAEGDVHLRARLLF